MSTLLNATLRTLASASAAGRLNPARVLSSLFAWPSLQASDFFEAALQQLGNLDEASASLAPLMFRAFVRSTNANRFRIFSQPSSSKVGPDVYMAEKVRQSIRRAFDCLLRYLSSPEPAVCAARSQAWDEVLRWGGYLEVDAEWSALVSSEKERSERILATDDASRAFILETISILERLDHRAADLGPDVVGWCLAVGTETANLAHDQAPTQLQEQAKAVLVALANYHRLTNSFVSLAQLLCGALEVLFAACESSKATRAVYTLLSGGVLANKTVREVLCAKGLPRRELDHIATELVSHAETPLKRRKTEKPSTSAAAMIGIRSRLFSMILCGTNTAFSTEPIPVIATSWAADIQLAARLRIWSACSPVQDTKPVETEDAIAALENADTVLETRLQLVSFFCLSVTDSRRIIC